MTTFGTMWTRINVELGDPDGTRWEDEAKQAIIDAIQDYDDETFWFSQDKYVTATDVTSNTVSGEEYKAFPTAPDLLTLQSLRIRPAGATDTYQLAREHWETLEQAATPSSLSTGTPFRYAVRGELVRLDPIPDSSSHTLYWAGIYRPSTELTIASGTSATNVWMTEGASLIRNRAKKIVARDTLVDGPRAAAAEVAELEALDILRKKTNRRLMTGRNRPVGPGQYRSRRRG